jgi:small subunit ribosomal protein S13
MGISKPKDEYAEKLKEEKKKLKAKKIEKSKVKVGVGAKAKTLVRLIETDLDGEKPVLLAIKKIKGVGHTFAKAIIKVSGLNPKKKIMSLSESELKKLEEIIKNPTKFGIPSYLLNRQKDRETGKDLHLTASDIDIARKFDIQRYINLRTYRGWRHMLGQPVRGQRTRSHFRKGRTVGVVRKAAKAKGKK